MGLIPLFLAAVGARAFSTVQWSPAPLLLPLPAHVTSGPSSPSERSDVVYIEHTKANPFAFPLTVATSALLLQAVRRGADSVFVMGPAASVSPSSDGATLAPPPLGSCAVAIASANVSLHLGVDEQYALDLTKSSCEIRAATVWGAMHGLETLSQIIVFEYDKHIVAHDDPAKQPPHYIVAQAPWHVLDAPRFQHRGVMLDTARHFYPVASITRLLAGMRALKLNAFHWHLSDAQSMPYVSAALPKLGRGALAPALTYSAADVRAVVLFGYERGIRTIIEVDTPSHCWAIGVGYPEHMLNCTAMYPMAENFWKGGLDVTSTATFEFIEQLILELAGLNRDVNPSAVEWHIGGDEVEYDCWDSSPRIAAYRNKTGLNNSALFAMFQTKMFAVLKKHQLTPWSWTNWDAIDARPGSGARLPDGAISQVWTGGPSALNRSSNLGRGIKVVKSDGFYIGGSNWYSSYDSRVFSWNEVDDPSAIIGAEACIWSELMGPGIIDAFVWDSLRALSERWW